MKKLLVICVLLLCSVSWAAAQSPYVRFNAGYSLGTASEYLGSEIEAGGNITEKYGSLGQGVNSGLGVGYYLNEHVAAELGFSYLLGRKYEFKQVNNTGTRTDNMTGRGLFFIPGLVLSTDFEADVAPYARVGLIIALPSILTEEESVSTLPGVGTLTSENKERHHGGLSLGFSGALGIQYKLGDNLALFGEAQFNALSYRPSKWEIKESKVNGQDNLDRIKVTKGDYVYEYKANNSKDNERVGFALPFSSIGINLGLKIAF